MKKILLIACVFVFAAVMAHAAETAQSDPATGIAVAKIVSAATITHNDTANSLDFGAWVRPTNAGTVTVNHASGAKATSDTLIQAVGDSHPDQFALDNLDEGVVYTVVMDGTSTLQGPTGSTPMTATLTKSADTITGDSTHKATLYVGGTLGVGANQAPGNYTGSYQVKVTY